MAAFTMMSGLHISGCQAGVDAEFFDRGQEVRQTEYHLLEETDLETSVSVLQGETEGNVVYLIGGIHGDETAGWKAAGQLKGSAISSGMLYILSPANLYGAEHEQRKTKEERDLNRNFPGDENGCDAERIAAAIYQDIAQKQPKLVLDLHEAVSEKEGRDFLGNSLICQSLESSGDLVLELLGASAQEKLTSKPLNLYGSPPPGSLNHIVTEKLGIPVITVETDREEALETRIRNHMEIVEYVLQYLEMK